MVRWFGPTVACERAPDLFVEQTPGPELPVVGGTQRSLLLPLAWVAAPLAAFALFLCCLPFQPVDSEYLEPAGYRKLQPVIEIGEMLSQESRGGSNTQQKTLRRPGSSFALEAARVAVLAFPPLARWLPASFAEDAAPLARADPSTLGRHSPARTPWRISTSTRRGKPTPLQLNLEHGIIHSSARMGGLAGDADRRPLRQPVPQLIDKSSPDSTPPCILTEAQREQLLPFLPPTLRTHSWSILYSTEQHGCSLRTAYQRLEGKGPSLLVVLDSEGHVFGAFTHDSWHVGSHYFGNGESFLFTAHPSFNVYGWTGTNHHFQLASHDSIALGSGGHFGLWLDECFEFGSSGQSDTYGNAPLGSADHFRVIRVEFWGFHEHDRWLRTPELSDSEKQLRGLFPPSPVRSDDSLDESSPSTPYGSFRARDSFHAGVIPRQSSFQALMAGVFRGGSLGSTPQWRGL